jgi:hypothetical protein
MSPADGSRRERGEYIATLDLTTMAKIGNA